MAKYRKYVSKLLFVVFLAVILLFSVSIFYQTREAKRHITEQLPVLLEETVREDIARKSKEIYHSFLYEHNPQKRKIGEYETRTVRRADTTFTFRRRIYEPGESIFRSFQTLFVDINRLHADSLQLMFDSLLIDRNIHAESIIGVTASFYTQLNDWSNDTTAIDINCRAGFLGQGSYEDINYYACIHYSSYTLWRLMPKALITTLFVGIIIIGITLFWWLRKRRKEKREGISWLKSGKYLIRDSVYIVRNKTLVSGEKEIRLSQQLHDLLLLFLKAEEHKVRKDDIRKKFWPNNVDSVSNMTSTVSRLNKTLKEAGCFYAVIGDPKDEEWYVLALVGASFRIDAE